MPENTVSYTKNYQVRYDECSLYGFLTPAAAVRYLQDIAVLHYNSANLNDNGNWIARRTVLDFHASVPAYANLTLKTFVGGVSKVTSQRKYELRLETGEPAVTGYTVWVYLGPNGRPARFPANFVDFFWPGGPTPIVEGPDWPDWPDRPPAIYQHKVSFSDLDIQAHMNNAAYLDLLDNAGWEAQTAAQAPSLPGNKALFPLHYDLEYLNYALFGHELEVHTWLETLPNGDFERLQQINREGRPIARARSRWQWK